MEGLGVDCPKQNVGIKQVGKISKEYHGTCDQQACLNLKSILRPNQAQPRQNEEEGEEPVRQRRGSQDDMLTMTSVVIESESC